MISFFLLYHPEVALPFHPEFYRLLDSPDHSLSPIERETSSPKISPQRLSTVALPVALLYLDLAVKLGSRYCRNSIYSKGSLFFRDALASLAYKQHRGIFVSKSCPQAASKFQSLAWEEVKVAPFSYHRSYLYRGYIRGCSIQYCTLY